MTDVTARRRIRIALRSLRHGGAPGARLPEHDREFHIAREARDRYGIPGHLFRSNGNVILADFRSVRLLAQKINEGRPEAGPHLRAGQLNAMGLIDEILHYVFRLYERTVNPGVLERALGALSASRGREAVGGVLGGFTERFPPVAVYRGDVTAADYLAGGAEGRRNTESAAEELLLLHLANINPAFRPFIELFDDRPLSRATAYPEVVDGFRSFLRSEPPFGDRGKSILDFLEGPMRAHPGSLSGQLAYMRERWGMILSPEFLTRMLSSSDLIREDEKTYPAGGPGAVGAPSYPAGGVSPEYPEKENFTSDTDWMPNIVLMAKNVYVWMHQLSVRYGRSIARLDEIPGEELARLARWNFTSLWLIGVWERSHASERIKRMAGNPEAAPSAYSLHDYEIAADLGGEAAFDDLARRAWSHGIRLAADMVPNHTGITSRWMGEHPEYFVQSEYAPFPSYRFTGPDLSGDPAYQVRIEDGYWTRSDAGVVFQRIDNATGRLRYIYHGNDGTNMPWNDTAQLDFLKKEVREAVIERILHVAEKFPVIRFDAAMTLTRKHFQRLWYPQPGTGGDIPSRADHALSHEEFTRMFPEEFWREVVDRINRERPQTLLLAEAFWLLEGYFVRTLGMHRVYNSAFMHMLMKEDNARYREAVRNTLHYNPEILKRYVNFMSNPDEQTAVEQFGGGDKYFGVATLMVTLPGLPMFAHGQVEGFREKYGMEYRRSYREEPADEALVRRHEREIFPLLGMRPLFSQTANFELYDVVDDRGEVIQDIFAYSNMADGRRALVCYNNAYRTRAGRIVRSVGKTGPSRGRTLGEALDVGTGAGAFLVFRELRSGLEYIREGGEFGGGGFTIQLGGYHCQVFLEFREVHDRDGSYAKLCGELGGGGVPDVAAAHRAMLLGPFHQSMSELFLPDVLRSAGVLLAGRGKGRPPDGELVRERFIAAGEAFTSALPFAEYARGVTPPGGAGRKEDPVAARLGEIRSLLAALKPAPRGKGRPPVQFTDFTGMAETRQGAGLLLGWIFADHLMDLTFAAPAGGDEAAARVDEFFAYFQMQEGFARAFRAALGEESLARRHALMVRALLKVRGAMAECGLTRWRPCLYRFLRDETVREVIGVNEYRGVRYFHKESFSEILGYFTAISLYYGGRSGNFRGREWTRARGDLLSDAARIHELAGTLEYRYDGLMDFISERGH